jgi:hypothetical protein
MLAIGLAIAGTMYIWFFNKWVKAPQQFCLTALSRPPETLPSFSMLAARPDALGNLRCPRCSTGVAANRVLDGSCPQCQWPVASYSALPRQVRLPPFRVRNSQHIYWIAIPLLFLCPLIIMARAKLYPQPGVDNHVARIVIAIAWGGGVAAALLHGALRVPRGAWFSRNIRIKTLFTCRSIEWSDVRYIAWWSKHCDMRIYTQSGRTFAFEVTRRREVQMRQTIRSLINGDTIEWSNRSDEY